MARTQERMDLTALKAAHLPRMSWRDILKGTDIAPADEASLFDYFSTFLPPGPCAGCGATLGVKDNNPLSAILGRATFTWGLAHGEGYCLQCGYPARAYHRVPELIDHLTLILQYHPDELKERA